MTTTARICTAAHSDDSWEDFSHTVAECQPATHTTTIKTVCNGGAKARRAVCSCGFLGVRFAYGPGIRPIATATAKAEADGAAHVAPVAHGS
jgi:hypothetical protein